MKTSNESSGNPELDEAISQYIAARTEAQVTGVWDAEQAAWDKFFELRVKLWKLDHPDD